MFDQNYIMREKIFCPFLPFLDLFYTKNDKKIKIYVVKNTFKILKKFLSNMSFFSNQKKSNNYLFR